MLRSVCAAVLAAALTAVPASAVPVDPAPPPAPAPAPPAAPARAPSSAPAEPASVSALLTRLRALYRQAEEASETYNAAEERLKAQAVEVRRLTGELTKARGALARGKDDAGRLARAQYRGRSDLSATLRLLLARDPRHALDQSHLVRRAARERVAAVARLEQDEKRAAGLATASREALTRERALAAQRRKAHEDVTARLREVEEVLASLSDEELGQLAELERAQASAAQRDLLATGELDGPRTPSREGREALAYAVGQIGKPYVWGAEGPDAFDCSGLTSRAWAKAGRTIPRTSQEQWRTLPKVPLRSLRPGDLVVYFPKATHVAIYLGDGLVVQAPRPGARVKVSPIAANPLLGAVRPDPAARPLPSYTPPPLPAGAAEGSDAGTNRS